MSIYKNVQNTVTNVYLFQALAVLDYMKMTPDHVKLVEGIREVLPITFHSNLMSYYRWERNTSLKVLFHRTAPAVSKALPPKVTIHVVIPPKWAQFTIWHSTGQLLPWHMLCQKCVDGRHAWRVCDDVSEHGAVTMSRDCFSLSDAGFPTHTLSDKCTCIALFPDGSAQCWSEPFNSWKFPNKWTHVLMIFHAHPSLRNSLAWQ